MKTSKIIKNDIKFIKTPLFTLKASSTIVSTLDESRSIPLLRLFKNLYFRFVFDQGAEIVKKKYYFEKM